jgi:hypothetical protein
LKRESLIVKPAELETTLLSRLVDSAFHVTSRDGLRGILDAGAIKNNKDDRFRLTFPQSKNSFGRRRGYVCLFDLRTVLPDDLKEALGKFYFLNPHQFEDRPVFLLLGEEDYGQLIPWTAGSVGEMRIPHVEAWYPGDISLDKISTAIEVTVCRAT